MSANRLFLVCSYHQTPEESICLGEREFMSYESASLKQLDKWFKKHAFCGTKANGPAEIVKSVDHFQLAHSKTPNWDVSPDATNSPAGAVRIALINGESH